MTKKDYIKFADLLVKLYNQTADEKEHDLLEMVREGLIQIFIEDNGNFNENKFNEYITAKTNE